MQIHPQNNIQFRGKEHITSPQKLAGMIRHLESKGKQYTVKDNYIYWGKTRSELFKDIITKQSEEKALCIPVTDSFEAIKNSQEIVKELRETLDKKKYGAGAWMSIKECHDLERYSIGVAKAIKAWRKSVAAEAARLDELINGKKIGTQELRFIPKVSS